MDKITVAELATECSVQNKVVLSELKRLGLYVFSPSATIDIGFAETIRKKIQTQREAEEAKIAEAEKKKEAETAKKAAKATKEAAKKKAAKPLAKKKTAAAAEKEEAPKARAPRKGKKAAAAKKEEAAPPKPSLAPRKGRKHYDRETAELVEVPPKPPEPPPLPIPTELPVTEVAQGIEPEIAQPPDTAGPIGEPAIPTAVPVAAHVPPELPQEPIQETAAAAVETLKPEAEGAPVPEVAEAEAAPEIAKPEQPAPVSDSAPQPATVPKKIKVRKAKSKVLMRTTTEKVVTPDVADRIRRGLREDRPAVLRRVTPARQPKRRRTGKAPVVERVIKVAEPPPPPISPEDYKPIAITEGVTLKELAEKMDLKSKYIIQKLISRGILASINQALDTDIAKGVCAEFGFRAEIISFEEEAVAKQELDASPEDNMTRPPVVTIMGHVDHGKTSLLDAIRETNVTATEAGGITQHIGAYQVAAQDRSIVFLDTPGHEAFTLMRARGAHVTDIVVLVVAADDGVMPQTIEAIHHAKAANVPIVVAINKIDKPEAQIDRVKQALSEHGLLAEDWGGDVVTVAVSAKQKTNLDLLLEMILLVADLKDFKANPKRLASGVVLEAKVDKGRGCVATVLVQNGALHLGDSFVAGAVHGRVRALVNDRGSNIKTASPS